MRRLAAALAAIGLLTAAPSVVAAQGYGGGGAAAGAPAAKDAQEASGSRRERGSRSRNREAAPAAGKERGMADAPSIVQAGGIKCAVSDANYLGDSKDKATGVARSLYEVACSDGPGYLLIANADKTLNEGFECLQLRDGNAAAVAEGKANPNALSCKLAGNTDPVQALARQAAPLVAGCTVDQARYIGSSAAAKENNYEIGCNGRPGAIVKISMPGAPTKVTAVGCEKLTAASGATCEYTSATEKAAVLQTLVTAAGRPCEITDSRFVGGSDASKEDFYEVKCAQGAGFMLVADQAAGAYKRSIECTRAQGVAGGCTLTDAVEASNAEAATYKDVATRNGFPCDVSQYRLLGMEQATKREVVELQCKERPEGVIAFLPAAAGKADFYDCTKVSYRKLNCSLTKPEQTYPRLTKELADKGRTCTVNGVRGVGLVDTRSSEFVEVACAGGPGFMLEYAAGPAFSPPKTVLTCADAKGIGNGCTLGAAASARR